ncbi:MAG: hypothetical protein LBL52_03175 [Rickettsiales bacterium]|jgi:hypothetical protein|nr:hypothetical protein [Rickettsiales bacterium]
MRTNPIIAAIILALVSACGSFGIKNRRWSYRCGQEFIVDGGIGWDIINLLPNGKEKIGLKYFMTSSVHLAQPVTTKNGTFEKMYSQFAYRMMENSGKSTKENGNILFYLDPINGGLLVVKGEKISCEENDTANF